MREGSNSQDAATGSGCQVAREGRGLAGGAGSGDLREPWLQPPGGLAHPAPHPEARSPLRIGAGVGSWPTPSRGQMPCTGPAGAWPARFSADPGEGGATPGPGGLRGTWERPPPRMVGEFGVAGTSEGEAQLAVTTHLHLCCARPGPMLCGVETEGKRQLPRKRGAFGREASEEGRRGASWGVWPATRPPSCGPAGPPGHSVGMRRPS